MRHDLFAARNSAAPFGADGPIPPEWSKIAGVSPWHAMAVRIAIPITGTQLAEHFGHCERFALYDVETESKEILAVADMAAPEHQPGLLPPWLKERGVTHVIARGLGSRARSLFEELSVTVITGAQTQDASTLVRQYLDGELLTSENLCTH